MELEKVKMLRNQRGSEDGFTIAHFEKGETYEIKKDLAETFIRDRVAEKTSGDAKPEYEIGGVYDIDGTVCVAVENPDAGQGEGLRLLPVDQLPDGERAVLVQEGKLTPEGKVPEQKAITGAPRNKAVPGAPRNKGRQQS